MRVLQTLTDYAFAKRHYQNILFLVYVPIISIIGSNMSILITNQRAFLMSINCN